MAKVTPKGKTWTEEELKKAASKFKTRRRFCEGNPAAYRAAARRKVLDKICSHMSQGVNGRPAAKILQPGTVKRHARKYQRVSEIVKDNPSVIRSAKHWGMMDEVKAILKRNRQKAA